jgi:SecD/SecF fusion protein
VAITSRFTATKDSVGATFQLLSPVPESSMVGAQVGSELRDRAIRALLLALFATVLYVRVRFAEWSYGIAVVVSLAHDVLVTLGALAVAGQFDLVQAEIDLAMIASFLTVIGYSQNDKIVLFDRVRELRPRSKLSLRDTVNEAINQCLSRTLLTGVTTMTSLIVLFAFSYGTRNAIESFSFSLLVGIVAGTYSSIYIATPVFLWCEAWARTRGGAAPPATEAKTPVTTASA